MLVKSYTSCKVGKNCSKYCFIYQTDELVSLDLVFFVRVVLLVHVSMMCQMVSCAKSMVSKILGRVSRKVPEVSMYVCDTDECAKGNLRLM